MLTKLWSWRLGVRGCFAEDDRVADDLDRSPGRMVVVDDVIVSEHLLVFGQLVDAVGARIDGSSAGFEDTHPLVPWLGGEDLVKNADKFLAVFAPDLRGREPWIFF